MCQVELRMVLVEDEAQQTKHNSLQEHIPYLPSLNDNSPLLQWQRQEFKEPFCKEILAKLLFLAHSIPILSHPAFQPFSLHKR